MKKQITFPIGVEPGAPGRCDVFAPFNEEFARRVREIGGVWNETKYAWSIAAANIDAIFEIMRDVFNAKEGDQEKSSERAAISDPLLEASAANFRPSVAPRPFASPTLDAESNGVQF